MAEITTEVISLLNGRAEILLKVDGATVLKKWIEYGSFKIKAQAALNSGESADVVLDIFSDAVLPGIFALYENRTATNAEFSELIDRLEVTL
jgi:hypothetical protein